MEKTEKVCSSTKFFLRLSKKKDIFWATSMQQNVANIKMLVIEFPYNEYV